MTTEQILYKGKATLSPDGVLTGHAYINDNFIKLQGQLDTEGNIEATLTNDDYHYHLNLEHRLSLEQANSLIVEENEENEEEAPGRIKQYLLWFWETVPREQIGDYLVRLIYFQLGFIIAMVVFDISPEGNFTQDVWQLTMIATIIYFVLESFARWLVLNRQVAT